MRYGICTGIENYKLVRQLGYDYIELSVVAVMALAKDERKRYMDAMKKEGISCEAFNILFPKTMPLVGPEADRKAISDYAAEAIKTVAELGGKVIVFGSGKSRRCPEDYSYQKAYRELIELCRMLCDIAASYEITIVIEPLSRAETNLICTMAEGAILVQDVNRQNMKLLSDYYHVMRNQDSMDDIRTIGEFGHIHIAAAEGRRFPVEPEETLRVFLTNLKAADYNGRISIEGKTDHMDQDGRTALNRLKELEA